jgi:hypothetical protein
MKKLRLGRLPLLTALAVLTALLVLGSLSGCRSMFGRGKGPVESFLFLAANNLALQQDVRGVIVERPDPKEIVLVVPPGTNKRRLIATLSLNTEATITVISSGQPVLQENGRTPNDFSGPVMYSVAVAGEKEPWEYRVTVRDADTDARLAQIAFPEGYTLQPSFSPTGHDYSVEVPYASRGVKIEARGQSQYLQSISIDGVEMRGTHASTTVDFQSGEQRTVRLSTMAEDGVSSEEYSILIQRGEPDRNNDLSALEIPDGVMAPVFSPSRSSYMVQVPYESRQVLVRVKVQSSFATVTLLAAGAAAGARDPIAYRGDPAGKDGAALDFVARDNLPLVVEVTAQDGSTREYLVELLRAAPDTNNRLADLVVGGSSLAPAFAEKRLGYTAQVLFATRQLTVVAPAQSKYATVLLESGAAAQGGGGKLSYRGDPASKEGAIVEFASGDRLPLAVVVTAQDGSVLRYTLDIRRAPPDRNADLGSLAVSAGVLSPIFSTRVAAYSVLLPGAVESVQLTVTTASPVAGITVAEQPALKPAPKQTITVAVGAGQITTLNLAVTAEDGSQRLYRVQVSREALPVGRDSNARLQTLKVSGAALQPAFSPTIILYDATMSAGTDAALLTAQAESPAASVLVDGKALEKEGRAVAVAAGSSRTLLVDVTAEDGSTFRYTVRVARAAGTTPPAPAPSGQDRVVVGAKNLRLESREQNALAQAKESVGGQARITVRYYRSGETLVQDTVPIQVRQQGKNTAITIDYRSGGVALARDRMVEVEVAIPTSGRNFLYYTEAQASDAEVQVEVPFLLFGPDPRVSWPKIGTPVEVAGYLSLPPAGKDKGQRAIDREELKINEKGEYGITVELKDAASGRSLVKELVWSKPGLARGHVFAFGRAAELPEGSKLSYVLSVQAKNGRMWQAAGTTQLWTTRLEYKGGFQPALLLLADELAP